MMNLAPHVAFTFHTQIAPSIDGIWKISQETAIVCARARTVVSPMTPDAVIVTPSALALSLPATQGVSVDPDFMVKEDTANVPVSFSSTTILKVYPCHLDKALLIVLV